MGTPNRFAGGTKSDTQKSSTSTQPNKFSGGCRCNSTPNKQPFESNGEKPKKPSKTEQPNKFSGGCTYNCTPKKQTAEVQQCVTDVHWYPEKRTLVIEKNNHKNIVVDLTEIIPAEPKLDEDIKVLVWNPVTEKYNNIKVADKGDEYTDAIQKIVVSLSSPTSPVFNNNVRKIAQQVVDENLVWKVWDDTEPTC